MIVNGTNLSMIRGDSETITVTCYNPDNSISPFATGDKVYFTVKENILHTEKAFQKVVEIFENGKAIVEINPLDTRSMKFATYLYDVQLTRANGRVTTLVKPSNFKIEGEVTDD